MWKIRKNKRVTAFDAERVLKAAHAPLHSVYELLHTSMLGLTDEEVEKRQTVFGKNERGGCKAGNGILASRWLSADKGNPICRKGKKRVPLQAISRAGNASSACCQPAIAPMRRVPKGFGPYLSKYKHQASNAHIHNRQ